jgi:2-isopropylmalate synthase/UPF0716 protein FxsA
MLYFLVYIFLEVIISVNISSAIGGLVTFLEIIISGFIGVSLLMNFKSNFRENLNAVSYDCMNLKQFQNLNLFTLIGAIFMVLPGFFTDILGALMQFSVFTTMLVNSYNVKFAKCNTNFDTNQTNNVKKESNVIDVEIINDNNRIS